MEILCGDQFQEKLYVLQVCTGTFIHFRLTNAQDSELHETDPSHTITTFGMKTATGTLRRHLIECHLDAWIDRCNKLGIKIKAKLAIRAIDEHQQAKSSSSGRIEFSKEAFVDALAAFIVADDQVSHYSY
jgi:hypothetical protein